MSMETTTTSSYESILLQDLDEEHFARRFLSVFESRLRHQALHALSLWCDLSIVHESLGESLAALQRPSFGSWQNLLLQLRQARREILGDPKAPGHDRLVDEDTLAIRLARLVAALPEPRLAAFRDLESILGVPKRSRPRCLDETAIIILLRNRIAHDQPEDKAWWAMIAAVTRRLAKSLPDRPIEPLDYPWVIKKHGTVWTFVGLRSGCARYLSDAGRSIEDPDGGAKIMEQFRLLLGIEDHTGVLLRRLLSRSPPAEHQGVLLGDVLVGQEIGAGGFATVHLGYQLSTGRRVAVKILRSGLPLEAYERFSREAKYLSKVNHQNVVKVFNSGEATWQTIRGHRPSEPWFVRFSAGARIRQYLVMEWIEGESLDTIFGHWKEEKPPADQLVIWLRQSAEALAAVHSAGLIHRDVSPSNLMIDIHGNVKLMDFGIARSLDTNTTTYTNPNTILGKVAYMSPEQLRAEGAATDVGPSSDVYSLCATFFELRYGERVFHHDTTSREIVTARKLAGVMPRVLPARKEKYSADLDTLILGGLEPDKNDRPSSMSALVDDLHAVEELRPIRYRRPSLARRVSLGIRRNRKAVLVAAVLAVVLLAMALVGGFRIVEQQQITKAAQQKAQAQHALRLVQLVKQANEDNRPVTAEVLAATALREGEAAGLNMASTRGLLARLQSRPKANFIGGSLLPDISVGEQRFREFSDIVLVPDATDTNSWVLGVVDNSSYGPVPSSSTVHIYASSGPEVTKHMAMKPGRVSTLGLGSEASLIAIGRRNGSVHTFNATGRPTNRLMDDTEQVLGMLFDPKLVPATITNVLHDLPAAYAGLEIGDKILRVNDTSTKDLPVQEVLEMLKQGGVLDLLVQPWSAVTNRHVHLESEEIDLSALRSWRASGKNPAISAIAFGSDRRTLVYGREDGHMLVEWLNTEHRIEWPAHDTKVADVIVGETAEGFYLVTATDDGSLAGWRLRSHEEFPERVWATNDPEEFQSNSFLSLKPDWWSGTRLAISPDARRFASVHARNLRVGSVSTGVVEATWTKSGGMTAPKFSVDGALVAVGNYSDAWILDSHTLEVGLRIEGHEPYVRAVSFSDSGSQLATLAGSVFRVFELDLDGESTQLDGIDPKPHWAWFSRNGRTLATWDDETPTITVWDALTGAKRAVLTDSKPLRPGIRLSADGGVIALCSGGTLNVHDTLNDRAINSLPRRRHSVELSAWSLSPNGSTLADVFENQLLVYDIASGTMHFMLDLPKSTPIGASIKVFFSSDGERVVILIDSKALIVSLAERKRLSSFSSKPRPDGLPSRWVSFVDSLDGKTLAMHDSYSRVFVWHDGKPLDGPWTQSQQVSGPNSFISMSPDGNRLIVLGEAAGSSTWKVWDLHRGTLLAEDMEDVSIFHWAAAFDGNKIVLFGPGEVLRRDISLAPTGTGLIQVSGMVTGTILDVDSKAATKCIGGDVSSCIALGEAAHEREVFASEETTQEFWHAEATRHLNSACEMEPDIGCLPLADIFLLQGRPDLALQALESGCKAGSGEACYKLMGAASNGGQEELVDLASRLGCDAGESTGRCCEQAGSRLLVRDKSEANLEAALHYLSRGCTNGMMRGSCAALGTTLYGQGRFEESMDALSLACHERGGMMKSDALTCGILANLWQAPATGPPRHEAAFRLAKLGCEYMDGFSCGILGWILLSDSRDDDAMATLERGCELPSGFSCYILGMALVVVDRQQQEIARAFDRACEHGDYSGCVANAVVTGSRAPLDDVVVTQVREDCNKWGEGESCIWYGLHITLLQSTDEGTEYIEKGRELVKDKCKGGDTGSCRLKYWPSP